MVYIKRLKTNEKTKWKGDTIGVQVVIGNIKGRHIIRGTGMVRGSIEMAKISRKAVKEFRDAIELEVSGVLKEILLKYGFYWDKIKKKM